jgi:hypothetical protein
VQLILQVTYSREFLLSRHLSSRRGFMVDDIKDVFTVRNGIVPTTRRGYASNPSPIVVPEQVRHAVGNRYKLHT